MNQILIGNALIPGEALGTALVSRQPISFWGGINPKTGEVIDRRHDCSGLTISGRIFIFPYGKGSSTASAVLVEMITSGTAPAAIITSKIEPTLALGIIVADTFFSKSIPLIVLSEPDFQSLNSEERVQVHADGSVILLDR